MSRKKPSRKKHTVRKKPPVKNFFPEKDPSQDGVLPEDRVRLKPILGIRPGLYLACLYSLVILLILFLILVYPGLSKPGTLLSVKSEPQGAAIRVDGVYQGKTPGSLFIPQGKRRIEAVLPGFTTYLTEREFGGRIFASIFFPKREALAFELKTPDPVKAFTAEAAEYAEWSFAGEASEDYQIPQTLSEGAYRTGPAVSDPETAAGMEDILKAAARFTQTKAGLRDLGRAKFLKDNGGLSPSPISLLRSAEDILAWLSDNPGASAWLSGLLPQDSAGTLDNSAWYQREKRKATLLKENLPVPDGGRPEIITVGGLYFTGIPAGKFVQAEPFPREIRFEGTGGNAPVFFVSIAEAGRDSWDLFLRANPEWNGENTQDLIERGLVDSLYLKDVQSGTGETTVTGVSWYAAQAYCRWLTGLLAADFPGWEARLPTEAEWEYAAKTIGNTEAPDGTDGKEPALPGDMAGGYWEWCAEPFAPQSFLHAPARAIESIGSPERPVRGGSKFDINAPSVTIATRASLPPSSCSPFVSFRPVLVPTR
ncbi:MAG: SUMF1/EgtB/PvdO family nonheme iron enzyme [Treponema sp.]|jgi:hypothetical protein|nr:SUMF1/EgtB/PvdO family nonheme iron enzyme [Treponema sp.]